jgi:hypothetical protein
MTGFRIKRSQTDSGDHAAIAAPGGADLREYEVGYRAGGGVAIAALAMAGTAPVSGDFSNSDYLKVAEEAFAYLEQHNLLYTDDGQENIVDDACALLAATGPFQATASRLTARRRQRARSLTARLVVGPTATTGAPTRRPPAFHAADAGRRWALLGCGDR